MNDLEYKKSRVMIGDEGYIREAFSTDLDSLRQDLKLKKKIKGSEAQIPFLNEAIAFIEMQLAKDIGDLKSMGGHNIDSKNMNNSDED